MTVGLSFHDDTWRIRVALSDLPDGIYRVERSVNQVFWQTVRGGAELEVSAGVATLDDWEYQEGVENHYRVVPVDPPAGLLLTGVDGDTASTPDNAALDITGDLTLVAEVVGAPWDVSGSTRYLLAKWGSDVDQRSYALRLGGGGGLQFVFSTDGTAFDTHTATVSPQPDAGGRVAVKAELDVSVDGDHTVKLFTAPNRGGPWTQLGSTLSGSGTTSIHSGTAVLEVGGTNDGGSGSWAGSVTAIEVYEGIGGSAVARANPDFAAQPFGTTGFTDAAGRLWSVNGDAQIFNSESSSITPTHQGKIILKSVPFAFLNREVTVVDFTDPQLGDRGGMSEVSGRSVPVSTPDQRASATFEVELRTDTTVQARDMQLTLAANPHLFLHVPANCPVPGGHVRVGDVGPTRPQPSARSPRRYWRLPCRLVAPPPARVVGSTMTYAGLLNLYGGYDNVLAANPAYADLLDLMGSPEDQVVV
jgi:hypothetical protein